MRLVRVELLQQPEERVPEEVDVRLQEHVPLGLGVHLVGLVDHGQELEPVQLPAGRVLDAVAVIVHLLVLRVRLEVGVVDGVGWGEVGEHIRDLAVADLVGVVRDDEQIRDARCDGREVRTALLLLFQPRARLQHHLDRVQLADGEVGAEVGVERGRVLERGEEALGGLFVEGRLLRRRPVPGPRERQADE